MKIWIAFTNHTDLKWLRFLKPGFRHCYAIINDGAGWITFDPLASYTDIVTHKDLNADTNLPLWLQSQGDIVIPVQRNTNITKSAPPMFYSCVEALKRLIGIHHLFIITPYQLYRHLIKTNIPHQTKETHHG